MRLAMAGSGDAWDWVERRKRGDLGRRDCFAWPWRRV
jgi:hypothetical protein